MLSLLESELNRGQRNYYLALGRTFAIWLDQVNDETGYDETGYWDEHRPVDQHAPGAPYMRCDAITGEIHT